MIFEMILMSFILFVETKSNAVASELLRHKILNGTVHTYYGQMAFLVEVFLESASCGACLNWHQIRRSLPTVFAGFGWIFSWAFDLSCSDSTQVGASWATVV